MYRIKDLRKSKKITPPQMADSLGISLSTYFSKEAGNRKFKPDEIVKICKLFNVRVEKIVDFYDKNTHNENFPQQQQKKLT